MKRAYWAGAVLVLGFLVLGLSTFSRSMTPYVSFAEAKAAGRVVQVMGALEKGTSRYDTSTKTLHFTLVDREDEGVAPRRLHGREARELRGRGLDRRDRPVREGRLQRREAPRQVPVQVPGRGNGKAYGAKKA